jgi:hypothetical protein
MQRTYLGWFCSHSTFVLDRSIVNLFEHHLNALPNHYVAALACNRLAHVCLQHVAGLVEGDTGPHYLIMHLGHRSLTWPFSLNCPL